MPLKSDGSKNIWKGWREWPTNSPDKLRIRKTDDKGMEVMNLTTVPVKSPDEIFEILEHSIKKKGNNRNIVQ